MLAGIASGVTLAMLSSLDCAKSGEVNESARTAQMPNEKAWKDVECTQLRQRISFIDSGELELSEPRVCADVRKKIKNILRFFAKKAAVEALFSDNEKKNESS